MAIRRYCGQKVGWFSEAHEECIASARQGCEQVASALVTTIADRLIPSTKHPAEDTWAAEFTKQMWSETKSQLDQLATGHRIPASDMRDALRKGWSTGAEQVATAEPIDPDRLAMLNYFYRAMGFSDQDMKMLKEIDYGGMLLTTQNIYFGGDHTTF